MRPKWYVLIVAVVLIQLSGVHSQPTPVAPPNSGDAMKAPVKGGREESRGIPAPPY
jgi:hypothetical protein